MPPIALTACADPVSQYTGACASPGAVATSSSPRITANKSAVTSSIPTHGLASGCIDISAASMTLRTGRSEHFMRQAQEWVRKYQQLHNVKTSPLSVEYAAYLLEMWDMQRQMTFKSLSDAPATASAASSTSPAGIATDPDTKASVSAATEAAGNTALHFSLSAASLCSGPDVPVESSIAATRTATTADDSLVRRQEEDELMSQILAFDEDEDRQRALTSDMGDAIDDASSSSLSEVLSDDLSSSDDGGHSPPTPNRALKRPPPDDIPETSRRTTRRTSGTLGSSISTTTASVAVSASVSARRVRRESSRPSSLPTVQHQPHSPANNDASPPAVKHVKRSTAPLPTPRPSPSPSPAPPQEPREATTLRSAIPLSIDLGNGTATTRTLPASVFGCLPVAPTAGLPLTAPLHRLGIQKSSDDPFLASTDFWQVSSDEELSVPGSPDHHHHNRHCFHSSTDSLLSLSATSGDHSPTISLADILEEDIDGNVLSATDFSADVLKMRGLTCADMLLLSDRETGSDALGLPWRQYLCDDDIMHAGHHADEELI